MDSFNDLLSNTTGMDIPTALAVMLVGLVVGFVARILMPGPDPAGVILTAVIGIAGSFVGSYLGYQLHLYGHNLGIEENALLYRGVMSVLGAMCILLLLKLFRRA